MKIFHLADLHIGKSVNGFSMLDDQRHILKQIIDETDREEPDVIIIAGDIYDRSVPGEEAVRLFEYLIDELHRRRKQVMIVSGNHDSSQRLSFGSNILWSEGVHVSPPLDKDRGDENIIKSASLHDEFGCVKFHLLPFVKPQDVKYVYKDREINTYTDAVRVLIRGMNIDRSERNVLICHQFITDAERSESEVQPIGTLDNVDASVFEGFDYVALGHLHKPQNVGGNERIRYAGSPLKYSFSEVKPAKSITVAELGDKNSSQPLKVRTLPLKPLHDMREIRGSLHEILGNADMEAESVREDYVRVILTSETEERNCFNRLRHKYPNIMELRYDNSRTRTESRLSASGHVNEQNPVDIFEDLFEKQNGRKMYAEQHRYVTDLFDEIIAGEMMSEERE